VLEDGKERVPFDIVESFFEVQLHDDRGSLGFVAAMEKVSSVDKIIWDTSYGDEARLILTNQERDEGLESIGKYFSNTFDGAVLQRDMAESVSRACGLRFGTENNVGMVSTSDVWLVIMKVIEEGVDRWFGRVSEFSIEHRAKAIWSWAGRGVRSMEGIKDFLVR
jgi:hypothetical protein